MGRREGEEGRGESRGESGGGESGGGGRVGEERERGRGRGRGRGESGGGFHYRDTGRLLTSLLCSTKYRAQHQSDQPQPTEQETYK